MKRIIVLALVFCVGVVFADSEEDVFVLNLSDKAYSVVVDDFQDPGVSLLYNGQFDSFYHHIHEYQKGRTQNVYLQLLLESKIRFSRELEIGFGFATGDGSARSIKQGTDSFKHYDVRLDHLYGRYSFSDFSSVSVGKGRNPYWTVSEMVWDKDIRLDGLTFQKEFLSWPGSMRVGTYFMEEFFSDGVSGVSDGSASYPRRPGARFLALQMDYLFQYENEADWKIAGGVYVFDHLKNRQFTDGGVAVSGTNNTLQGGKLVYDYDAFHVVSDVDFHVDWIDYFSFYQEYISNLGLDEDSRGLIVGTKMGDRKIHSTDDWRAGFFYQYLEKDAWLDIYPGLNSYRGHTGVKGFMLSYEFGLPSQMVAHVKGYYFEQLSDFRTFSLVDIGVSKSF